MLGVKFSVFLIIVALSNDYEWKVKLSNAWWLKRGEQSGSHVIVHSGDRNEFGLGESLIEWCVQYQSNVVYLSSNDKGFITQNINYLASKKKGNIIIVG